MAVPPGRATRPTSDRAREGLFGTVQAVLGSLSGARVLDLYAGSGAVGLEALSRGASHALLVESAPAAIRVVRANIAALDLPGACLAADRVERVLSRGPASAPARGPADGPARGPADAPARRPAPGAARGAWRSRAAKLGAERGSLNGVAGAHPGGDDDGAGAGYDFVFADPPYAAGDDEVAAMLLALGESGWLAAGALVAVERPTGGGPLNWPQGYLGDRARRYGDATLWYGLAAGASAE